MPEGIVRWFNEKKGYGFIAQNESEEDVFLHFSNVKKYKKVKEGDEVVFNLEKGEKGKRAIEVDLKK